jgi:hypothetical protein
VKVKNKEVSCIIDRENIHRLFKMSCNRMLKYRISGVKQTEIYIAEPIVLEGSPFEAENCY